ncbi:hypothetical protein, partial [Cronobacter malonaticus]|uniref:hypothetical protein n=1 Tax=Cronobacter malonaticus TaxID=413503 RepID=UPI001F1DE444
ASKAVCPPTLHIRATVGKQRRYPVSAVSQGFLFTTFSGRGSDCAQPLYDHLIREVDKRRMFSCVESSMPSYITYSRNGW